MSESLTYGSVGGPVGQPPALPGTHRRPVADLLKLNGCGGAARGALER